MKLDMEHSLAWRSRNGEFSDRLDAFHKLGLAACVHVGFDVLPSDQSLEQLCLPFRGIRMVLLFNRYALLALTSPLKVKNGDYTPANRCSVSAKIFHEFGEIEECIFQFGLCVVGRSQSNVERSELGHWRLSRC